METLQTSIVIPTLGRPSLRVLLEALAASPGPAPEAVIVVDDRVTGDPLDLHLADLDLPNLTAILKKGLLQFDARYRVYRETFAAQGER